MYIHSDLIHEKCKQRQQELLADAMAYRIGQTCTQRQVGKVRQWLSSLLLVQPHRLSRQRWKL